jgi:hypothetical protein
VQDYEKLLWRYCISNLSGLVMSSSKYLSRFSSSFTWFLGEIYYLVRLLTKKRTWPVIFSCIISHLRV